MLAATLDYGPVFYLNVATALFSGLAAGFWLSAARIKFVSKLPILKGAGFDGVVHTNPPGQPLGTWVDGIPMPTIDEISSYVQKSGKQNARAAFFAGFAAAFAGASAILQAATPI